jgi:hypothetical protein
VSPRVTWRLWRLIRYHYPYTTAAVLLVAASVTMLFFTPTRKAGLILLTVLAVSALSTAQKRYSNRA